MAKYLNLTGLQTLWTKIKAVFAPKENGVYYVPGTSGYANWSANTYYAVGANVVNPSGECWTCKTAHTSGSSWSSTNWNRISAVALTGTIDGVTALYAGLKIAYRFQVLGGEGSTTLNVNNLGAKTITRGTGAFYRWTIGRNGVAILVYDGSAWRFGDYDSNDQYVLPDAYCSTAAGTQAKAAISIGFSYSRHNNIPFRIYFTNANTYDGNLTLNVNSQGAKPLWINGSASSSSNKTIVVGVYWCYYDGTQFQLWTDKSLWAYKYRGDGSSLTETFSAASSRANIASGESNATIFGKIAKWLGDLKALAFKDNVSDSDISGTISDQHIASATTWDGKYTKPSTGIPKTDLAIAVQTSLGKADTALQSHQDISGKMNASGSNAVAPSGNGGNGATATLLNNLTSTELDDISSDSVCIPTTNSSGSDTSKWYKRPLSKLWPWIKSKLTGSDVNIGGNAATATTAYAATYGRNVDLGDQSVSLLTKVKELGQTNQHYVRFYSSSDGGAGNITDRPVTGSEGFVCIAIASRRVSSSDYRYQLIYLRRGVNTPYYANITNTSTSISWVQGITSSDGYGGNIAMGSGNGNTLSRALTYKVELVLQDGGAAQSGWKLCVSDSVGSDDQTIYFT